MTGTRGLGFCTTLVIGLLLLDCLRAPAWGQEAAATVRYQLKPLPGHSFVSTSYTSPVTTDGRAVGWSGETNISSHRPIVWDSDGVPVDLTAGSPAGLDNAAVFAVQGGRAVGAAEGSATGRYPHAILWNVSGRSAVDLHPIGFQGSNAYGISGNSIVGSAHVAGGQQNAMLWKASTGSYVNLNPVRRSYSIAFAASGRQQVGYGEGATGRSALLWYGSAESFVDLNAGNGLRVVDSVARNAGGSQQVGMGYGPGTGGRAHALLWEGTAASMTDLHPTFGDFFSSEALATNGAQQVGYARTGNDHHAFLWSGTAASAVDLHLLLPPGFVSSNAWNIDAGGNVFGLATDVSGNYHFVAWEPSDFTSIGRAVPEPSGLLFCAAATALFVCCRSRSYRG